MFDDTLHVTTIIPFQAMPVTGVMMTGNVMGRVHRMRRRCLCDWDADDRASVPKLSYN